MNPLTHFSFGGTKSDIALHIGFETDLIYVYVETIPAGWSAPSCINTFLDQLTSFILVMAVPGCSDKGSDLKILV